MGIIVSRFINLNTMKNAKLLYYTPSIAIESYPDFFNLIFEVFIDNVPKNRVFIAKKAYS